MNVNSIAQFQNDYLLTWTEPDPAIRRRDIDRMWCKNGRMIISALKTTVQGVDDIDAHITRVHDDSIKGKGLRFTYDQHVEAADALLLRWSMLSPAGDAVGRGVDVIFLDQDGKVQTVYMFMGVD